MSRKTQNLVVLFDPANAKALPVMSTRGAFRPGDMPTQAMAGDTTGIARHVAFSTG